MNTLVYVNPEHFINMFVEGYNPLSPEEAFIIKLFNSNRFSIEELYGFMTNNDPTFLDTLSSAFYAGYKLRKDEESTTTKDLFSMVETLRSKL